MKYLTEEVLSEARKFIEQYQIENGTAPSYRAIGQALGISSTNTVSRIVNALIESNSVESYETGSKTYLSIPENLSLGKTHIASIVGSCPCGEPILAMENIQATVALPDDIFGNAEHFLLYAKGNSMINRGIFDGDLMVVRIAKAAEVGDVVIARVNGDEATAKILAKSRGKYYLKPANDTLDENGDRMYKNIHPNGEWDIVGIVDNVIHKTSKSIL